MKKLTIQNLIWSKGNLNNEYSKTHTEKSSNENEIISLIENIDDVIFIRNGSSSKMTDLNIL